MAEYLDLENNCVFAIGCPPIVGGTTTGDVDGATVDLEGYRYCTFIGVSGAEGDTYSTTVVHEFQVEESDDASAWTDVADADLTTTETSVSTDTGVFGMVSSADSAHATGVIKVGTYKGSKRYVRAVTAAVDTHTNGTPIAVITIKHGAKTLPAS